MALIELTNFILSLVSWNGTNSVVVVDFLSPILLITTYVTHLLYFKRAGTINNSAKIINCFGFQSEQSLISKIIYLKDYCGCDIVFGKANRPKI